VVIDSFIIDLETRDMTRLTTPLMIAAAATGLALSTQAASAQHADFVLFGDPNPAAASQTANQKHVHPITSGYFHEDSFVTSDVRAWFIYHDFPKSSVIGGGNAEVYAAQVRLALTESLQLVAYKDGYISWDTGIVKDDGWNDIAAGLKWNFIQDWENEFHAAVGVGYELSTGSSAVLQDDDEWRFWASVNKGIEDLHLGATVNYFITDDPNQGLGNSDAISWHLHADLFVCDEFSPVVELNGHHVVDDGGVVLPFSGLDVVNLGGSESEDVITIGLGGEFRPMDDIAARIAYETPLTDNNDVFGYRWTFSLVYSF